MNREGLLAQWRHEASLGMTGWDFSHLYGRYLPPVLPWDYVAKARDFLKPGVRLLHMGTGGGGFPLAGVKSPPPPPQRAPCRVRCVGVDLRSPGAAGCNAPPALV